MLSQLLFLTLFKTQSDSSCRGTWALLIGLDSIREKSYDDLTLRVVTTADTPRSAILDVSNSPGFPFSRNLGTDWSARSSGLFSRTALGLKTAISVKMWCFRMSLNFIVRGLRFDSSALAEDTGVVLKKENPNWLTEVTNPEVLAIRLTFFRGLMARAKIHQNKFTIFLIF